MRLLVILVFLPFISDAQLMITKNENGILYFSDSALAAAKITGLATLLNSKQNLLGFTPYNATNPNGYISAVPAQTFASLTSKPTTLSGYGITDAYPLSGNPSSFLVAADIAGKQATLVSGSNIKTVNGATLLGSTDVTTTRKVAQADIAATASATSTTTLFTPTVSGFYRVAIYMKISTTGTSPVAGPVTITYTEPDGSVAQSHVMLLQSVTGSVVTTTVNNSTTTGTVNGSMVIYAKTGVAIQYAIAVSGTFGAGRYIAHIACEQL